MKARVLTMAAAGAFAVMTAAAVDYRVTALTPEYVLVQADLSAEEDAAYFADVEVRLGLRLTGWKREKALNGGAERVFGRIRGDFVERFRRLPGEIAFWPEANGAKHLKPPQGESFQVKAASLIYNAWIKTAPMKKGTTLDLGMAGKFVYDPAAASPVFKVNQVGYAPKVRKYAYLGAWLGPAGALPLKAFAGGPFTVKDARTGAVALSGRLAARPADAVRDGVPFTGEETLEAELTPLKEGEYFLEVEGIGRSRNFKVSGAALAEAWGVHMQGLYNKRCGIEKKAPYTQWPQPACHQVVTRGVMPSEEGHYGRCVTAKDGSPLVDGKGKPIKIRHFPVIAASEPLCADHEKLTLPGGYHDAADYDRRPMHLIVPMSLALDYLLKPGDFTDGQLCIPESGNGIPDVLDEAYWGIRHLEAAQQADGGVGTWIETRGHPGGEHEGPAKNKANYYLAIPTRGSCYQYAGAAAVVARAFKAAGRTKIAERLLKSALRAWNWAETHPKVVSEMKVYTTGQWQPGKPAADVVYTEPEGGYWRERITAALNLSALTGEKKFFDGIIDAKNEVLSEIRKNSWGWSPYTFLELTLKDQPLPLDLAYLEKEWSRRTLVTADQYLKDLEENFPYRTPWFAPTHGFVTTMSWGTCHPLRRAAVFLAAYEFSKEEKYLEAIYLANDFHNGCNPRGETLTSGLGGRYPVRFLDLQSCDDDIAEWVGGITPYRWTYGIPPDAKKMIFNGDQELMAKYPVWRRFPNVEAWSVAASEYTVWETMQPPAAVLGYLLPGPLKVPEKVYTRRPASDLRELEGYWTAP